MDFTAQYLSEEEQLALALAESASLHQQTVTSYLLTTSYERLRSDVVFKEDFDFPNDILMSRSESASYMRHIGVCIFKSMCNKCTHSSCR